MLNGRFVLSRFLLAPALFLALAASGCQPTRPRNAAEAQPSRQAASSPAVVAAPPPSAPASPTATPPGTPEPADGKWLADDQGREYFLFEVPRIEGAYLWLEEGKRIRIPYGLEFDVDHYDDKTFFVKYYRARPQDQAPPRRRQATPEDLERIEASYRPDVGAVDRLLFTPISAGLPTQGQWREGFDVADVDGDGKLDVVHGPARKAGSSPALFLGDGKGSWRRWTGLRLPGVPFDYGDAAAADLNGDGKPDLVLASHLRGITAMLGDGKGGFSLWSQGIDFQVPGQAPAERPAFSSRAIAIVDWNRDGRPDILAMGEGPSFTPSPRGDAARHTETRGAAVYLNHGDGTWTQRQGSGPFSDSLAVADFNADGRTDFVTGSGWLGSKALLDLGREDGSWSTVEIAELRPSAIYPAVATADFDGDRRPDLAVGYLSNEPGGWRTGIDVLLNRAESGWQRRTLGVEEGNSGIWSLAAGDLDGDGAADLIGLDGEGLAWTFLGDGKGAFAREESPEIGPADGHCHGYHARLVDLDGDGRAELIAAFAGEGEGLPLAGIAPPPTCPGGGSLRAWKAGRKGS